MIDSGDFLQSMAAASAERLREARVKRPLAVLEKQAHEQHAPPPLKLSPEKFDLIAEVKKGSPSAGRLAAAELSAAGQAGKYAAAGAAAISVLTEPSRFAGSLHDLEQVVADVDAIPVMRKDFLVDPYQVVEARAAGAGGVLLIAGILEPPVLRDMLQTCFDLGMFALIEAFGDADLQICTPVMDDAMPAIDDVGACRMLLGINCRDLRTLEVDFARFEAMAARLPRSIPWVAESGVDSKFRASAVAGAGYSLALVGTALMRADDPVGAARELLAGGREAATNAG